MIAKHVTAHGHKSVQPTIIMLRHWWGRLNTECFQSALLPCQLSIGKDDETAMGLCYPLGNGRVRINLDPRHIETRGDLLSTLAHEMVHQWQHQHGQPMTHGEDFKAWGAHILAAVGITI